MLLMRLLLLHLYVIWFSLTIWMLLLMLLLLLLPRKMPVFVGRRSGIPTPAPGILLLLLLLLLWLRFLLSGLLLMRLRLGRDVPNG